MDFRETRSVLVTLSALMNNCVTSRPPIYVQFLTREAWECSLIWKEGFCRCSQVKMRSFCIMALNPKTGILIRKDTDTQTYKDTQRRRSCDNRGREERNTAARQGMPKITSNHQQLGRSQGGFFPFRAFRGSMALLTPWFLTSILQNCEGRNFSCIKSPSLYYFLWQL